MNSLQESAEIKAKPKNRLRRLEAENGITNCDDDVSVTQVLK